jgi:hypothetical protein
MNQTIFKSLVAMTVLVALVCSGAASEPATLPSSPGGAVVLGTVSSPDGSSPISEAMVSLTAEEPTKTEAGAHGAIAAAANQVGAFAYADIIPQGKYVIHVLRNGLEITFRYDFSL